MYPVYTEFNPVSFVMHSYFFPITNFFTVTLARVIKVLISVVDLLDAISLE
jgi:hypothetical protein